MLENLQQPIYQLAQDKKRALIPKIVILVVLGFIFYLGILINLSLLELRGSEESTIKIVTLIILLIIIIVGIILSYYHANFPYLFYRDRVVLHNKEILYTQIINTQPKKDILGKIFHTYSINLGQHFHLRHLPEEVQIQAYLQQLIDYAKRNQN